ncbi:MAG: hypothetical protein WBL55_25455 [Xanthobacteraceae bacterium]
MAAGQLAGGLSWLAISGENAPGVVATAPVPPSFVIRAKIEAVLGVIAVVFARPWSSCSPSPRPGAR